MPNTYKIFMLLWLLILTCGCRKTHEPLGSYRDQNPAEPKYRAVVVVQFKDKGSSISQLATPLEFLSEEAISRRRAQGISINNQDLPIDPQYIASCVEATQGKVLHVSKWLNYLVLHLPEDSDTAGLEELAFVQEVNKLGEFKNYRHPLFPEQNQENSELSNVNLDTLTFSRENYKDTYNLFQLHNAGIFPEKKLFGKNKKIALIDLGFAFINDKPEIAHLIKDQKITGSYDFLMNSNNVNAGTSRGNYNLGIMAAINPGKYMGTAPAASYVLLIADAVGVQEPLFETAWVAALEYADSCGVDIVSSYSNFGAAFDNPIYQINSEHTDGRARCSQAADIAFEKGMLVIQSLNSGGGSSRKIVVPPADAKHILSVGNLRENGSAVWSSIDTHTADGRIKPELGSLVENVPVIYGWGGSWSNAHASAIIAGLTACLWEGLPHKTVQEIREILLKSSHNYEHPDTKLGYGITNFEKALLENL